MEVRQLGFRLEELIA
jgi:isopenicillin N synthase-like dioxygenase